MPKLNLELEQLEERIAPSLSLGLIIIIKLGGHGHDCDDHRRGDDCDRDGKDR